MKSDFHIRGLDHVNDNCAIGVRWADRLQNPTASGSLLVRGISWHDIEKFHPHHVGMYALRVSRKRNNVKSLFRFIYWDGSIWHVRSATIKRRTVQMTWSPLRLSHFRLAGDRIEWAGLALASLLKLIDIERKETL